MYSNIFSDILLPATMVSIMLGVGLGIEVDDLRNISRNPRDLLIGLGSQLVLLPCIAFIICFLSGLQPAHKVGLVIVAACPGGITSNLVNFIIRTNVALCVSITIVNGFITLITIPLIVRLALFLFLGEEAEVMLPVLDTIFKIVLITVLPASVGMLIRTRYSKLAGKLENPLRIILPVLLILVYSGVIFIDQGNGGGISDLITLFPAAFLLNILSMAAGLLVTRVSGLTKRNQVTVAVEVGLQNSALAIFIASTLLDNQMMALVAVTYGSFSFFSTALFGYLAKRFL